jgi:hypothetical protein
VKRDVGAFIALALGLFFISVAVAQFHAAADPPTCIRLILNGQFATPLCKAGIASLACGIVWRGKEVSDTTGV